MKVLIAVAAMFAAIYFALSLSLAMAEVLLMRAFDQALPASALLAAGVAAYATGQTFARLTGNLPKALPLLVHGSFMAAAMVAMTLAQPVLVTAIFGADAPRGPFALLPAGVFQGFLVATWCLTIAAFRTGARHWLETPQRRTAIEAAPA